MKNHLTYEKICFIVHIFRFMSQVIFISKLIVSAFIKGFIYRLIELAVIKLKRTFEVTQILQQLILELRATRMIIYKAVSQ